MAEQQNFRTAFNGFNRDDVVQYIEELNARHAAEVNQLNADLQYLQEKLDALESACPDCDAPLMGETPVDSALIEELEAKVADAEEAARTTKAQLDAQKSENLRLQVLLDAALARQVENRAHPELDTYRRAERVERDARNRARIVSDKANAALSDATVKVDQTAAQLSTLTEDAMQQLKQLMLAISGSKQVLRDTATALYAIRPEDEE